MFNRFLVIYLNAIFLYKALSCVIQSSHFCKAIDNLGIFYF